MANDLLSALRTYLTKLSSGEKTPQEMAAALNVWARESGEAIKTKVEEEVARTVKKMGFAKQEDLDRLAREVEALKSKLVVNSTRTQGEKPDKATTARKKVAAKNLTKKSAAKQPTSRKSAKKSTSKKGAK